MIKKLTVKVKAFEEQKRAPIIYALLGAVFYVIVGIIIKKYPQISPTQLLYYRSIICLVINHTIMRTFDQEVYPESPKVHFLLIIRCIFGGLAHFCYYQAIGLMNLSDAIAIFLTSPIWTSILAGLLIKEEKLDPTILVTILVSFCGILLIVKPHFLMVQFGLAENVVTQDAQNAVLGLIICCCFSLFESFGSIIVKSIGASIPVTVVVQYVYISGFALNGIFLIIQGKFNENVYFLENIVGIFILSIVNLSGQLISNRALQLGKASQVIPLNYTQVVMSFLVDILIFHKPLSYMSLVGACLILLSNYKIITKPS